MKTLLTLVCITFALINGNTAEIIFKVNMNEKVLQGAFNPSRDYVDVAGTFNSWGGNSLRLSDEDNDLIYEIRIEDFMIGERIEFKFRINGSWDGTEEFPGGGANRRHAINEENEILTYWYNDELPPNSAPISRFASSSTHAFQNALITFNNKSLGSYANLKWEFEGGTPTNSTDINPKVEYKMAGNYNVTLIAYNDTHIDTLSIDNYINIEARETTIKWWNNTVFYEIFVRSFYDSNGDGIGDFKGLEQKLDYLNDGDPNTNTDLGITGIWLMPIHESPSYHGYDVVDYKSVNPDYGTMEEFESFLNEAHKRGIKVIIDFVMNHSSKLHPWFKESKGSTNNAKRDWFRWEDNNPKQTGPWGQTVWHYQNLDYFYGLFWSGMPDLNYNSDALKEEMFDAASFWIQDIGVDGFRLDAVRYIFEDDSILEDTPETFAFWHEYNTRIKQMADNKFSIGESWTSSDMVLKYIENDRLDACFEFTLAQAIIDGVNNGTAKSIKDAIQFSYNTFPHTGFGTFLSNHDQNRVFESLNRSKDKQKLAASIYLTLPGIPFLYYGEELAMLGTKPDEDIRRPMQWSGEENAGFSTHKPWENINSNYSDYNVESMRNNPNSILNHYVDLIDFRNNNTAMGSGKYIPILSDNNILAYERKLEDKSFLIIHNLSSRKKTNITIDAAYSAINKRIYKASEFNKTDAILSVDNNISQLDELDAYSTGIYIYAPTTNILEQTKETNIFALSPNPTTGEIQLALASKLEIDSIQVFDINGKLVESLNQHKRVFNVEHLENGLYFFQCIINNKSYSKSFVIAH